MDVSKEFEQERREGWEGGEKEREETQRKPHFIHPTKQTKTKK
jgi:hypothetical protein